MASGETPSDPQPPSLTAVPRRHRWWIVVALVLAMAAGGGIGALFLNAASAESQTTATTTTTAPPHDPVDTTRPVKSYDETLRHYSHMSASERAKWCTLWDDGRPEPDDQAFRDVSRQAGVDPDAVITFIRTACDAPATTTTPTTAPMNIYMNAQVFWFTQTPIEQQQWCDAWHNPQITRDDWIGWAVRLGQDPVAFTGMVALECQ